MVERRPPEKRFGKPEPPLLRIIRENRERKELELRGLAERMEQERQARIAEREQVLANRARAINSYLSVLSQERNPRSQDPEYHKDLKESRDEHRINLGNLLPSERKRVEDLCSILSGNDAWTIFKKLEFGNSNLPAVEQIKRFLERYGQSLLRSDPEKALKIQGLINWLSE